jgi:serine phosphatase RsbU (regulator of sigma subunit)/CheY-like chemotaxis protein
MTLARHSTQEFAAPPGEVLLIDDSIVSLDAVAGFLEDMGWNVHTAQNGADALAQMETLRPEVVIADLNMPDMSGIEVFRRIHHDDPTLPVIILSGTDALASVLESMHAGVFDFVPKADHVRMLPAALARAIAHCRVLRDNMRLSDDLLRINQGLEQRVRDQTAIIEAKVRRESALEREAALASLRKELEIAAHLQSFLQPRDLLAPGLEIAAGMANASEVSGDYYDIRPTLDGCWIGIGDVAGHGLNAGLVMLMIQSGLGALIMDTPNGLPHDVLPPLNRMLHDNLRSRMGRDDHATLTLCRFFRDGRLAFSGAHEDILVCGADGCRFEPTPGTWLGIQADISRGLHKGVLQLHPGDVVVLFTDGVPEARRDHECFGLQRLASAVEARRHLPVAQIERELMQTTLDFGGSPPRDDTTIIVMRYRT